MTNDNSPHPDLDDLFRAIVDKFEDGTPDLLCWAACEDTAELIKDYYKQAKALVDRITPEPCRKIIIINRPDISDPLNQRSYFGYFNPVINESNLPIVDQFNRWSRSVASHHDIFVEYL